MCFVKVGDLEVINLKELKALLVKLKKNTITLEEAQVFNEFKTHLISSFNKRDNEVIEKLNLILKYGLKYEEAKSPVTQFLLKGVGEEIKQLFKSHFGFYGKTTCTNCKRELHFVEMAEDTTVEECPHCGYRNEVVGELQTKYMKNY